MGSGNYTENRWKENLFLLMLFTGLIVLSFYFLKDKAGLAPEECAAYSIANTSCDNSASHLTFQNSEKNFNDITVPEMIRNYYKFRKTYFSPNLTTNMEYSSKPSWQSSDYYTNYLITEENSSFNYSSVIKNCTITGTAPLYYLIFHTASSLFPFYSIKYVGFALNLLFVLGIFFVIFYICRKHLDSVPTGFAACILFCFSIGNISAILCTQNHLMTVLLMLLSCSLHLGLLYDDKDNVWNLRFLIIVTILGILTDYYFLAFTLIEMILYIVVMLCFNHYKSTIKYLAGMFISTIASFALYPAIFSHLCVYIKEILSNLHLNTFIHTLTAYFSTIQNYLLIRGNLCFAFLFLIVIVCMLALVLNPHPFSLHFSNFKERIVHMEIADIFLILLFILYTVLFILFQIDCSIQSSLGLLPFAAILICYLLYRLCYVFIKSNVCIGLFIGAIVSIVCFLSLFTYEPDFLQKENKETIALANAYADTPCIFIENTDTDVYDYLLELGIHKKSMLINSDAATTLKNDKTVKQAGQLILYLNNQTNSDSIIDNFLSYGKYSFSKRLYEAHHSFGNMQVYLLYR